MGRGVHRRTGGKCGESGRTHRDQSTVHESLRMKFILCGTVSQGGTGRNEMKRSIFSDIEINIYFRSRNKTREVDNFLTPFLSRTNTILGRLNSRRNHLFIRVKWL